MKINNTLLKWLLTLFAIFLAIFLISVSIYVYNNTNTHFKTSYTDINKYLKAWNTIQNFNQAIIIWIIVSCSFTVAFAIVFFTVLIRVLSKRHSHGVQNAKNLYK
ncbi:hypothetical protein [Mycoplasmopsis glycophila]|uniref:Uncharacterized protein n=1 Tax=Mycoplasmopsis glycophila TaxID=171285 RepID=A0A449AUE1_9BACT|nr:hypothetical protein [Mycoplasmopsis glycophila]VEU70098.1 Uncharacterised protein [Mycoplasmopsis glycophila]